jgi:hypothetical protein
MQDGIQGELSDPVSSPLVEQRASIIFMLFLLVVSAITATVVGFRVKSADIDRKAQLLATYTAFGGDFQKLTTLGSSLYSDQNSAERNTFILAYEINERARAYGLYRVLETTPPPLMNTYIQSLFTIGATESAHSTEDAWHALQEPPPPGVPAPVKNMNPSAARFARQYDRYLARDTEVKLFTYLRDHQSQIVR